MADTESIKSHVYAHVFKTFVTTGRQQQEGIRVIQLPTG